MADRRNYNTRTQYVPPESADDSTSGGAYQSGSEYQTGWETPTMPGNNGDVTPQEMPPDARQLMQSSFSNVNATQLNRNTGGASHSVDTVASSFVQDTSPAPVSGYVWINGQWVYQGTQNWPQSNLSSQQSSSPAMQTYGTSSWTTNQPHTSTLPRAIHVATPSYAATSRASTSSSEPAENNVQCECGLILTGPHANGNLSRHRKSQHCTVHVNGKKNLKCQECGQVFHRSDALKNHLRKRHDP